MSPVLVKTAPTVKANSYSPGRDQRCRERDQSPLGKQRKLRKTESLLFTLLAPKPIYFFFFWRGIFLY